MYAQNNAHMLLFAYGHNDAHTKVYVLRKIFGHGIGVGLKDAEGECDLEI